MTDATMIDAAARLCVERSGSGFPVVLAHGLTATRRYVVHGSRLLERSGFDVLLSLLEHAQTKSVNNRRTRT
ncbi:MAG: hypothetical protein WDZ37_03355, partial [Solirubrobacterales bacterium]